MNGKAVCEARVAWISRLDTPKDVVFGGEAAYNTSGRMCVQNLDSDVCFVWCSSITASKKIGRWHRENHVLVVHTHRAKR